MDRTVISGIWGCGALMMEEEKAYVQLTDSSIQKYEDCQLFPSWKKCRACDKFLVDFTYDFDQKYFYCTSCRINTPWNYGTTLQSINISLKIFHSLLLLFINDNVNGMHYFFSFTFFFVFYLASIFNFYMVLLCNHLININ